MRNFIRSILLPFLFLLSSAWISSVVAFDSSPHLILNFAQMNELPWTTDEGTWQKTVKPTVEKEISGMRETLGTGRQSLDTPVLGWSTLLEYMNFPMDTPSENSPYVVKAKRIMEVAEDLRFPVFMPLNGFQWWDQLPELYNWWDEDGTHTDPRFFSRQKDPAEFKARFIAGYDPDNQWNVEWQSLKTPMKLNYRNWGSGGFLLAPPPNIIDNHKASLSYRTVQEQRLRAISTVIARQYLQWKTAEKDDLFVGLSIGTEVSLNASATPADEFKSYGYRSTQDLTESGMKSAGLRDKRIEVVRQYLEDNARLVTKIGIPKDFIYTHVLGEQDSSDPHYGGIADGAFNLYSNPGVSLYGYAKNPTGSKEWNRALEKVGNPDWGILEYNAGDSGKDWTRGLSDAMQHAKLTVIYNWDGLSPKAIPAIKQALSAPNRMSNVQCQMPIEHIQSGIVARLGNEEINVTTTSALPHGIYTKFTEKRCGDHTAYNQPETFYVPVILPPDTTPDWVKGVLDILSK